jgi:hypothetical protein
MTVTSWRITRRQRRAGRRATALVIAVLAITPFLAGCRTTGIVLGGYQLHVVRPGANSTETLPMTITWTAGSLYQPGDSYAVFLDSTPIGVGRSITDLVPMSCLQMPGCSRATYYQQANVWLTSQPSLTLTSIPEIAGQNSAREYHTITIVILNKSQVRTSEEYASLDFLYLRPPS